MGCFQKSKDEPKLRTRSGHLLGRCFAPEGWHTDAVEKEFSVDELAAERDCGFVFVANEPLDGDATLE